MVYDDPALKHELLERGISEASMRAHASTLGVTDAFIKECRLSESSPALRKCIKCDLAFLSSGIHNRLCRRCPTRS
ncbi:MAG TPA: hypothetical protein VHM19_21105 [Polyangiales bacterium]|jgi:hypothetical protein|nr:hypothetical protein [Polyangiales bacterium]